MILLLLLLVVFVVTARSAAEAGWRLITAEEQTAEATRGFLVFAAIAITSFVVLQVLGETDWLLALVAVIAAEALLFASNKFWPKLIPEPAEQPK